MSRFQLSGECLIPLNTRYHLALFSGVRFMFFFSYVPGRFLSVDFELWYRCRYSFKNEKNWNLRLLFSYFRMSWCQYFLIVFKLCTLTIVHTIPRKADWIEMPGDIMVYGMFGVRAGDNCTDGVTQMYSVQEAEAVRHTLKMLNLKNYIPGVSIGELGKVTCQ